MEPTKTTTRATWETIVCFSFGADEVALSWRLVERKPARRNRPIRKRKQLQFNQSHKVPFLFCFPCAQYFEQIHFRFYHLQIIWVVVMLSLYTTAKKISGLGDQLSMKQVFRNTWFWLPRNMWTAHKVFVYNKDVLRNGSNGHLFCPNNSSQSKECPGVCLFLCIHTGLDYMFTSSSSGG